MASSTDTCWHNNFVTFMDFYAYNSSYVYNLGYIPITQCYIHITSFVYI